MAALRHPNIVSVLEIGQHEGFDFIASQWVEGSELSKHLASKNSSTEQAIEWVRQLSDAIEHAHQHGVIHRDIKPANIVIDCQGTPMLLDFGLAQQGDPSLTLAGDVVGTPAYMPPEQADGRAWLADPRSDVYSLGVILFQLVCGQLPFQGSTAEVIHQLANRPPPRPRQLNPRINNDLQTIVLTCLEKDPSERYQTAQALSDDLQNLQLGKPISAKPIGWPRRTLKWAKRKPFLATALAAMLLATAYAIGAGSQLMRVRGERDRAQSAESVAKQAERELQIVMASDSATAGKLAMQRGRFNVAVEYFDRSLAGGIDEPVHVNLMKLDALFAARRCDVAKDELDRILNRPVPASLQASVEAWKAELALDGFLELGDPIELLVGANNLGSSKAAQGMYLDAMLATSSPVALDGFRAVLDRDPFHYRARRMTIIMLLSLARMDEAASEALLAQEMYPESEDFSLFSAIALAHAGQTQEARSVLQSLDGIDYSGWLTICELVDNLANELKISSEFNDFEQSAIQKIAHQFSQDCSPLMQDRGWLLPPRIQLELSLLLTLLTQPLEDSQVEQFVKNLKSMTDIHPEASLYTIYAGALTRLQNLNWGGSRDMMVKSGPRIAREALRAADRAKELPTFANSTKKDAPYFEFSHAITMAIVYKVDVEENQQRMIESAAKIELGKIRLKTDSLRAMTIGLISIGANREAIRFADAWIESAGPKDFDSSWHRLMCDWRDKRLLEVIAKYLEFQPHFPDNEQMKNLYEAAKRKVNKAIEPMSGEGNVTPK